LIVIGIGVLKHCHIRHVYNTDYLIPVNALHIRVSWFAITIKRTSQISGTLPFIIMADERLLAVLERHDLIHMRSVFEG
jgi:hypothetical protein